MADRLRWKVYGLVTRLPGVCPANAHGALIWRTRPLREMAVDGACRRDCAANGSCWCNKLRRAGEDGSGWRAQADAEAWGGKGPSASYEEWLAEGQEDGSDG